jgi:hypothetical protein
VASWCADLDDVATNLTLVLMWQANVTLRGVGPAKEDNIMLIREASLLINQVLNPHLDTDVAN